MGLCYFLLFSCLYNPPLFLFSCIISLLKSLSLSFYYLAFKPLFPFSPFLSLPFSFYSSFSSSFRLLHCYRLRINKECSFSMGFLLMPALPSLISFLSCTFTHTLATPTHSVSFCSQLYLAPHLSETLRTSENPSIIRAVQKLIHNAVVTSSTSSLIKPSYISDVGFGGVTEFFRPFPKVSHAHPLASQIVS